jgi:hypothetical protein
MGWGTVLETWAVNPLAPAQQTDTATNWFRCCGCRLQSSTRALQRWQIKLWLQATGQGQNAIRSSLEGSRDHECLPHFCASHMATVLEPYIYIYIYIYRHLTENLIPRDIKKTSRYLRNSQPVLDSKISSPPLQEHRHWTGTWNSHIHPHQDSKSQRPNSVLT